MSEYQNAMDTSPESEVFAAYQEVLRKIKETQKITKQEEKIITEKKQIVETAKTETEDSIAKHVISLKLSINKTLDELEDKLITEQKKLIILQQAIEIQKREMEDLYSIKVCADTLAVLHLTHKKQVAELEEKIQLKRQHWKKEQEDHEIARKEKEEAILRSRQREEDEYTYQRDLARKKEVDQYEANKRNVDTELATKRAQLEAEFKQREDEFLLREKDFHDEYEKTRRDLETEIESKRSKLDTELKLREEKITSREIDFQQKYEKTTKEFETKYAEREKNIAGQEAELKAMREQIESFPKELENMRHQTEKAVTEQLTQQFNFEVELKNKDFDSEKRLYQQEIEALRGRIEHLEALNYSFKPLAFNTIKLDEKGDKKT